MRKRINLVSLICGILLKYIKGDTKLKDLKLGKKYD